MKRYEAPRFAKIELLTEDVLELTDSILNGNEVTNVPKKPTDLGGIQIQIM